MKILWINGNPNKNPGGTETHSIHFINSLKDKVDLFAAISKDSFVDKNIELDAEKKLYISINGELSPISTYKLIKFAKKIRPDFVIGNNGNEYINTFITAWISGAKAVLFRHMTNKQPFFIKKFIFPRVYKVIAVSDYVKEKLVSEGVSKDKIAVIPNFLEKNFIFNEEKRKLFRKKFNVKDKFVVLFVGKIDEGKGIFDFLEAVNKAKRDIPELYAFVIGTGKDLEKSKQFCKKYKCEDFVKFEGRINNPLVYYLISDVFIMPSLADESFARTVIEAMATKTAVIAYPSGNIPYIISNLKNGILTEK
ncbi:glycosyltransferase family 4 protein, partial [Hydrogenivirga sp. 128-5-R1-1]|uniref:glycosyltransferase family 4 protein n=1 Tax=Hydrogenivirga sp. 128-5-R1-1 TaxID=392423 RepID=UPI00015F1F22